MILSILGFEYFYFQVVQIMNFFYKGVNYCEIEFMTSEIIYFISRKILGCYKMVSEQWL